MGFFDWLTGRKKDDSANEGASSPEATPTLTVRYERTTRPAQPYGGQERWYVDHDDPDRFKLDAAGLPPMRLIPYKGGLSLCEDATGKLIGATDQRLFKIGVYSYNAVGEAHHPQACKAGNFTPGARVRLLREPQNEHDLSAVAIHAADRDGVAGYVSKGHAKRLAKLMDAGLVLEAVATRGTRAGQPCDSIAVVAATPDVLAHLLSPRPDGAPQPLFAR